MKAFVFFFIPSLFLEPFMSKAAPLIRHLNELGPLTTVVATDNATLADTLESTIPAAVKSIPTVTTSGTIMASATETPNTAQPILLSEVQINGTFNPFLPLPSTDNPSFRTKDISESISPYHNPFITSLRRSATFTNAAYCSSASISNWACGVTCDALGSGVQVLRTGGDNGLIPAYYIAYDPLVESIVVAHQGTDPRSILSLSVDAEFFQAPLDVTYFPFAPANTSVHSGFQKAFLRTVDEIEEGVRDGLANHQARRLLVVGHSLGAAIAMIEGVYFTHRLGPEIDVVANVFGLPRVGNKSWADLVDSTIGGRFLHMHLAHDPVVTIPPRGIEGIEGLEYVHPAGEVFDPLTPATSESSSTLSGGNGERGDVIGDGAAAVLCPGRENENCSARNVLALDISDHLGPYLGVGISSFACPN